MKKAGFTMIELIFVIVILGILAAVAIPKLAATRDDAEIASVSQAVANGIQEVATYVTSKGKAENDLALMSNSFKTLQGQGKAKIINKKIEVSMGSTTNCITVEVNSTVTNDNINVIEPSSNDAKCKALQKYIDPKKYSLVIRGESVKN